MQHCMGMMHCKIKVTLTVATIILDLDADIKCCQVLSSAEYVVLHAMALL